MAKIRIKQPESRETAKKARLFGQNVWYAAQIRAGSHKTEQTALRDARAAFRLIEFTSEGRRVGTSSVRRAGLAAPCAGEDRAFFVRRRK
jgi:hypothetical protein